MDDRKKLKEDKITTAAISSFREKGIEKTSIRDIMEKSGLGLGTFYLYFDDKKNLEDKIVLDILTDLIYKSEAQCSNMEGSDKYIAFINYIIDELIKDPIKLEMISENANWALYAKLENDDRFKEAENTLKFLLNQFHSVFKIELSESTKLFILSLTLQTVLTTCKSSLMEESVLTIDEMKPVLFQIIRKIFV